MSMTRRRKTGIAAAGVAAGVLVLGSTAGIAYASSPTPSPSGSSHSSASSSTTTAHKQHRAKARKRLAQSVRGLHAGRALHGDVVVLGKDKKPMTLTGQRGVITSVSSTSVSVKSLDGYTATYVVGKTTHVRVNGTKSTASALKTGEKVAVSAAKSGSSLDARHVIVPKPHTKTGAAKSDSTN